MKEYIAAKIKNRKAELVLLALVAAQILYLLVFNVCRMKYMVNFDSNTYLVQVMQIWKQGKLLIDDYYYSTMLTWDMPTLLAVVFYGITHDVFLAYGLANDVLIILFVFVLNKLCNDLEFTRPAKYLTFVALFATYQYGSVDYMEELFVNGALYGFRIMFMLLLMDVLVCFRKGKPLGRDYILYGISLVGFFLCGISSGIFELGCCVLPLLLYEIWDALEQSSSFRIRSFFNRRFFLVAGAAVVSVCGLLANRLLGFDGSSAMKKATMPADGLGKNMINVFSSLFQLFGWPEKSVGIASLAGIFAFAGVAVTLIILIVFITATICSLAKSGIGGKQRVYCRQVLCIFLVNALLFCFADLTYGSSTFEYRYWLMAVIPIFLEFGILLDNSRGRIRESYRQFLVVGYVLLAVCVSVYKNYGMWHVDWGGSRCDGVVALAEECGADTLFVYSDYFSSRIYPPFATDQVEVFAVNNAGPDDTGSVWVDDWFHMPKWGNYVKYDGDCMRMDADKKIAVFVTASVGEDYRKLLAKADRVVPVEDGADLLITDENYMDFVYGIPEEGCSHSRDYFNWGYDRTELALDESGDYVSSGKEGEILSGEFTSGQSGVFSAALTYDIASCRDTDCPAVFRITVKHADGSVQSYSKILTGDETLALIEGVALQEGNVYRVAVEESEGTIATLRQIDYGRQ